MKCKYITIEREYGSGGTQIARRLAEQTGIPCYGYEILDEVSKKYGIPADKLESYEETSTGSLLYSIYMMAQAASYNSDMLTKEGHIYVAEQAVIQQFAANSRAIFLGHCASEALKKQQGVINVFIRCTDTEEKNQRIIYDYGIPAEKAEAVSRRYNKKRSNYYYANTAQKWDDLRNYDIVLDSGKLGIDRCVEILKAVTDCEK